MSESGRKYTGYDTKKQPWEFPVTHEAHTRDFASGFQRLDTSRTRDRLEMALQVKLETNDSGDKTSIRIPINSHPAL